jgi:hypothetical protein
MRQRLQMNSITLKIFNRIINDEENLDSSQSKY